MDVSTGATRARFATSVARLARWIAAGRLLVIEAEAPVPDTRSRLRVLESNTGERAGAIDAVDITRLAVRGDEIHVGYAGQSIGVRDRNCVARRVGLDTGGVVRASHLGGRCGMLRLAGAPSLLRQWCVLRRCARH